MTGSDLFNNEVMWQASFFNLIQHFCLVSGIIYVYVTHKNVNRTRYLYCRGILLGNRSVVNITLPTITYHNLTLAEELLALLTLIVASLSGMLVSAMEIVVSLRPNRVNRASKIVGITNKE